MQDKEFERMPKAAPAGGYKYTGTEEELAAQRGVVWDLVKSFGKNLVGSKDLIGISLPVRLFEPRSYLERLADGWWSAPIYLTRAAKTTDPIERFKLVITFVISGFWNTCENQKGKPFNPILGETFEATFEDGTQIYCEQASHHPPVTCWQVYGPDNLWHYYGYGEWSAAFRGNSVKGHQFGPNLITFQDGTTITYSLPEANVGGILFGDRIIEYLGTIDFRDEKNGLSCDVVIDPKENTGFFGGWFSGAKRKPTDYFKGDILRFHNPADVNKKNPTKEDYEVVSKVEGSWLSCIEFDGEKYWNWHDSLKVYTPIKVEEPLPSDCRYRQDVQYLAKGELEEAGEWKKRLEIKQRKEAALRKEGYEIRKREQRKNSPRDSRILKKTEANKRWAIKEGEGSSSASSNPSLQSSSSSATDSKSKSLPLDNLNSGGSGIEGRSPRNKGGKSKE
jgi:hypothetical protein